MKPKTKQELRERVLRLLKKQKKDKRLKNSRIIRKKLFAMQEFKKSKVILFYASFGEEVETFEMMKLAKKLGKTILLPKIDTVRKKIIPVLIRFLRKDLKVGTYGIKEPKQTKTFSLKNIDMVIVPAVAFDKENNRLGRGGGYYDRFSKRLSRRTVTVGLAFDFQLLSSLLPHLEKHDVRVHHVLTN